MMRVSSPTLHTSHFLLQSVESCDRCYWRRSPVTPGVTGAVRRCAPAPLACNTRCYRRAAPAAPGITGGPIRGHEIYCNQSECDQVQMRCNWRLAPVTPGVTGERRRCAPVNGACNTGCYRRMAPVTPIPTFHGL